MKRLLIVMLMVGGVMSLASQPNWPKVSVEQAERNSIEIGIARIKELFTAYGAALSSPALKGAITQYLQQIGTPLSYKIYQEMVASGELR